MAFDEAHFHLPAVYHLADGGSLIDFPAATTPGYHLALAATMKAFGQHTLPVRLFSALVTASFLFLLGVLWVRATDSIGAWLALPALGSLYVLPAGAWLLPDNAAWLTVLGVLWLSILPRWEKRHVFLVAILCTLTVLVRQSNVWVLAPVAAAGVIGPGSHWRMKKRLVATAIALAPASALFVGVIVLWGGLVPPAFQARHEGLSPIAPAWLLVQFTIVVLFYLPVFWPFLSAELRSDRAWGGIAKSGALGLLLSSATESTYSMTKGRWSGLWRIVRIFPATWERSPLVILGAVTGCILLRLLLPRLGSNPARTTILIAIIGFGAACTLNQYVYDRYFVGFVLILIPLIAISAIPGAVRRNSWSMTGVAALFLLNAGILLGNLFWQ